MFNRYLSWGIVLFGIASLLLLSAIISNTISSIKVMHYISSNGLPSDGYTQVILVLVAEVVGFIACSYGALKSKLDINRKG